MEDLARENSWKVFEITAFDKQTSEERDYYILIYRSQLSSEYCITNSIVLIYLSDAYPTTPYGFAVEGGVCEDSLDLYDDSRVDMIASFHPN